MRGLYIPDLEIPENCIGCNYRDPSYGNCCELMIDNPSDSFEEQYRLCPIRILCKNAVSAADVRTVVLCKDCLHEDCAMYHSPNWFCADGEKKEES